MHNRETLTDHFRRARHDPAFRAHLLENARYSRSGFGWAALAFAILAAGDSAYGGIGGGAWFSRLTALCAVSCGFNLLIYERFGDRVAALSALDEAQGGPEGYGPESALPKGGKSVGRA